MKKEVDIEGALRRSRAKPGEKVRRAVLDRYARRIASGTSGPARIGLWRRGVSLRVAAVGLIVAAVVSFVVGRQTAPSTAVTGEQPRVERPAALDVEWEVAASDLL